MSSEADRTEKPSCFVIMPISDAHGYDQGHFGRVYEHILRPAILQAGYHAVRADDANKTDYIVVGIVQRIIKSEMVLCDLSAKNPNVMYELGLRHAFDKPVVLVRDKVTDKVFDIQGLRYTEYDSSLRVDSVQKDIDRIAKAIQETAASNQNDINSVIRLAGIKPAEMPIDRAVSPDTQILLSAIASLERRLEPPDNRREEMKFFVVQKDGNVVFRDNTEAKLGDEIYDAECREIGKLVDVRPAQERIYIQKTDGNVEAFSIRSKGMSADDIPF